MKKIYLATRKHDVMFVSNTTDSGRLRLQGEDFMIEQDKCFDPPIIVKCIESLVDVPEDWRHACLWGTDDEITPTDFLKRHDANYQEYLRLKAIFE